MMKIIVSTNKGGLDDTVNPTFGRCPTYTIVDAEGEKMNVKVETNQAASASMGAGIQAAQFAISSGAEALITGNVGPNAFDVLDQGGLTVYSAIGMNVRQAVEACIKGNLKVITSAQGRGRCGHGRGRHGFRR